MKVIVIKNNLKDALSVVERASSVNINLPILKNVLIEAHNNIISLTTTNLEIAISFRVSGKIIEDGKITVPTHTLFDLVNNIQGDRINIEKKHNDIVATTDNHSATIKGLPSDEFPIIPQIKNKKWFIKIMSGIFKESLAKVVVATQFSELRPELNNVLLHCSLESMKLVGTDSFRLAEKSIPKTQFQSVGPEGDLKILIPLKTSQELLRVLRDDEELVIYHDENQILFKTERLDFISRISDGNYPDYAAVIPKEFSSEAVVERQEFMQTLRVAGIFGSRTNEVKIRIPEHKKIIEVFSSDQVTGENKGVLSAKTKGKVDEAGFNWRYLLDGLKAIDGNEVCFCVNEEKPALMKSQNDASYFYILVPNLKA